MSAVSHLLTQTITVSLPAGVSATGDPTYGAQSTQRARVEFGTKMIYGRDGTERQCEAALITESELPMDARVWLPGEDTTNTSAAHRPILTRRASSPGGALTIYETYL